MGYIVEASINEYGGITGGSPGDQTANEIHKGAWYANGWHTYLECTDTSIASKAAKYAQQIAADDDYGYDQSGRWNGYYSIVNNGGTVKGGSGDFDCSSLVIACYILAGVNMSADGSTYTMVNKLLATGMFKSYTDSAHVGSDGAAKTGGIYVSTEHTCMYVGTSESGIAEVTKQYLGSFTLTAYCPCVICCGKTDGITASGVKATANHTIAVDTSVIPLGSKVEINGKTYYAEDTGGAIVGNHIDIFFNNHNEALAFGTQTADVYLITGDESSSSSGRAELSSVVTASVTGSSGSKREYITLDTDTAAYELYIVHGGTVYVPVVQDDVIWTTNRKNMPGTLEFDVVKDEVLDFTEGDTVMFNCGGAGVFYGYVFTKSRTGEQIINVKAYDQTRYFKNKDTYIYENKTLSELFKLICEDYMLNVGSVEDTGYVIPSRIEDNETLFDIIQNAVDETYQYTGRLYYFYDDYGRLTLKNVNKLNSNVLVDSSVVRDFDYKTSIDDTYNRIVVYSDDSETGERTQYIYQDGTTITSWGILQKTEKLDEDDYPDVVGKTMLDEYNVKGRELTVKNMFGDVSVRAGVMLPVQLALGDITVNDFMTVERAEHRFRHGVHSMTLELG